MRAAKSPIAACAAQIGSCSRCGIRAARVGVASRARPSHLRRSVTANNPRRVARALHASRASIAAASDTSRNAKTPRLREHRRDSTDGDVGSPLRTIPSSGARKRLSASRSSQFDLMARACVLRAMFTAIGAEARPASTSRGSAPAAAQCVLWRDEGWQGLLLDGANQQRVDQPAEGARILAQHRGAPREIRRAKTPRLREHRRRLDRHMAGRGAAPRVVRGRASSAPSSTRTIPSTWRSPPDHTQFAPASQRTSTDERAAVRRRRAPRLLLRRARCARSTDGARARLRVGRGRRSTSSSAARRG